MNKLKKDILKYDDILIPSIDIYRSLRDVNNIILKELIVLSDKLLHRSKVLCNEDLNQVWYPIDVYNGTVHVYVEYIKLKNLDKDWLCKNGPNTLFHLKYDLDLIRKTHYFMEIGDQDKNGVMKLNIHLSNKFTTRHQLKSLLSYLDVKRHLILDNEVYNIMSYKNKSDSLFNDIHLTLDLVKIQED